jgi:hypothetical protein
MLNRFLFRRHLDEDEMLIRIVHKHWLVGLKALFWPTLFLAACAWGLSETVASRGLFLTLSLLGVVIGVWWLRNFFDYYLDAWIITTSGVIDVAWHGWFHRESSRILYSDIQGISYEINGILPTLLRYGTVSIEKVSTGSVVSLEYVKSPRRVEADVLKCMEAYLHAKNMKDAKQVQELLSTLVAQQIQLRELSPVDDD